MSNVRDMLPLLKTVLARCYDRTVTWPHKGDLAFKDDWFGLSDWLRGTPGRAV